MAWKNQKKAHCRAAICFYVLAVILLMYGAYMVVSVYQYLCTYYESAGIDTSGVILDNIQYFVSNCSIYFIDAVLCYGLGVILQLLWEVKQTLPLQKKAVVEEETSAEATKSYTIEYQGEN